jgi:hypothetical protein
MVQVVPNRTEIDGTIISSTAHPTLPDYQLLDVAIDKASPVPGFTDLLSNTAGSTPKLAVRKESLPDGPLEGTRLHGHAYLGGPDAIFAQPMPDSPLITGAAT